MARVGPGQEARSSFFAKRAKGDTQNEAFFQENHITADNRSIVCHATRRSASKLLALGRGGKRRFNFDCSPFGKPSLAALKAKQATQESLVAPNHQCSYYPMHIFARLHGRHRALLQEKLAMPWEQRICGLPTFRGQEVGPPRSPGQAFKTLFSNVGPVSMKK